MRRPRYQSQSTSHKAPVTKAVRQEGGQENETRSKTREQDKGKGQSKKTREKDKGFTKQSSAQPQSSISKELE